MTILSPLAEVARAVRIGDLQAAEKALDRLDDFGGAVASGRAAAVRRDPPLPPIDQTELMKAEDWGNLSKPIFPDRGHRPTKKKRRRK
jgi:hypothetical protein